MAPFTEEQTNLIERFIRAVIQDSKPTADCQDSILVNSIKEEMVTDRILLDQVYTVLNNKYREQNNG